MKLGMLNTSIVTTVGTYKIDIPFKRKLGLKT